MITESEAYFYLNCADHSVVGHCGKFNLGPFLVDSGNHGKASHTKSTYDHKIRLLSFQLKILRPFWYENIYRYLHEVFWASSWRSFFPSLLFCAPISNFYLPNLVYIYLKSPLEFLLRKIVLWLKKRGGAPQITGLLYPKRPRVVLF